MEILTFKKNNRALGLKGEDLAVKFLKKNGFKILERNYRNIFGEIDIIALDKNKTLIFIEVKTRTSKKFGLPQESITSYKKRNILKTVQGYLKEKNIHDRDIRFDVVTIMLEREKKKIDLIKNALEF
jgi:putative endonuclease